MLAGRSIRDRIYSLLVGAVGAAAKKSPLEVDPSQASAGRKTNLLDGEAVRKRDRSVTDSIVAWSSRHAETEES